VFGAGQYSMRIWLDPTRCRPRLDTQDVVQALQQQSAQVTAGQIGMPPRRHQSFQYTLNVLGRLDDAEQFANVIVKAGSAGEITRVRDVGRVELGAQTYSQVFQGRQAGRGPRHLSVARRQRAHVASEVEAR
jgi:HAE1 family hydrophobic/amphiphilic exporter-1